VRRRRGASAGLVRGCCIGILLVAALAGWAGFLVDRALAAPDLGAVPTGPSHGADQLAIAAILGPQLAVQLAAGPHGVITLSERDLTIISGQHNPNPSAYRHLTVRVRDHLLVVSADVSVGPMTTTSVARVDVVLEGSAAQPVLASHLESLDAGRLTLPGFLSDRYAAQISRSTSLTALFGDSPVLRAAAADLECVSVSAIGLSVGFHRPGVLPAPASCAS